MYTGGKIWLAGRLVFIHVPAEVLAKFVFYENARKTSLPTSNRETGFLDVFLKLANFCLTKRDKLVLKTLFKLSTKNTMTFSRTASTLSKDLKLPLSSVKWSLHKLVNLGLLNFQLRKKLTLTSGGELLVTLLFLEEGKSNG
ncbi:MAG: hypothetical protein ACP6IU_10755 [Candidatus Asgardarchaeia archaeon]